MAFIEDLQLKRHPVKCYTL